MNIEQLAINAYLAEQERLKAKKLRGEIMHNNSCLCVDETGEYNDGVACYHKYLGDSRKYLPFDKWCDNCKKAQPYHIDYRKKAVVANIAKGNLTKAIKRKINKDTQLNKETKID